ncbi:helix-turn-helix transcriptional regulator [Streptomyces sp. NPDC051020]|uniref:helix-turn-helix transcriptional regulator n=1 Tax=Streptomyces sp. NPDC051020 TaxID=3155409 RepID=UPI0034354924
MGLTADQESVYRVMLREPDLGVDGLSKFFEWPRSRVLGVFEELAELSLVRRIREDGRDEHSLVHPGLALASLLSQGEEELLERQRRISQSRRAIADLLAEYSNASTASRTGEVQRFEGMREISRCIEELSHTCESEVVVFATGGAQPAQSLEAAKPLDRAVLDRGVHLRYLYLDSVRNDAATTGYAQWLTGLGGQVRTVPELPPRMIIYDRAAALVPLDPNEADSGAVLLRGAGIVAALHMLFEQFWEQGNPFGPSRPKDADGLTAHERTVLRLLAGGHTDDVIARKMGISVRTGRRTTADLMRRLGARSRFQAGALASERGWLGQNPIRVPDQRTVL